MWPCFPSRYEPFGIVALEGWRANVRWSSEAGRPEKVVDHDVTGTVTRIEDPDSLAGAFCWCCTSGHSIRWRTAYDRFPRRL